MVFLCTVFALTTLPIPLVRGQETTPIGENEGSIGRLNYGVTFQKQPPLYMSREYWMHTFEIELPTNISITSIPMCEPPLPNCDLFNSITSHVNIAKENTMSFMNTVLTEIFNMVPESNLEPQIRKTRAILSFVGSLSKTLFGTATIDDVNLLAAHINQLIKRDRKMSHVLEQHGSHISSFMKLANHRMQTLKNGIQDNHNFIVTTLMSTARLQARSTNLTMIVLDQVQKANEIQIQLSNFLSSIKALMNGQLTTHLISEHTLRKTLTDIISVLRTKFPQFSLIQNQPYKYYQHAKFLVTRRRSKLYITLKFPITSFAKPLALFKAISFPHPIKQTNTTHASQILDLPNFIAITSDHKSYTTFNYDTLYHCQVAQFITCDISLPMYSINTKTCILSLYEDDKTSIFTKCDFRLLPNMLKEEVFELSPTLLLLTNVNTIIMKCTNETKIIQGCTFCIQTIPCRCSLKTPSARYQPRLVHCQDDAQKLTRTHPLNLALIHEFFGYNKVKYYLGNTYFTKAVNVTIPDFKIYNHKFKEVLASDKTDHLSLKRMVNAAKKDEMIFQTLSEPILDGQLQVNQRWPDLNGYLGLISLILGSLSFLGLLYMLYKLRALKTSLLVLQQVHNVHTKPTQPSFLFPVKETDNTSLSIQNALNQFSWVHGTLIIGIVTCVILIVILVILVKRTDRNTTVMLEITSGGSCVAIPVTYFPLCPSYWEIQPPNTIHKISLENLPSRTLNVEWPGFKVINKLTRQQLTINTKIQLGIITYFTVKRILKQPFCAYILIVHQGLAFPLRERDKHETKSPNETEGANNLYPLLTS